MTEIERIAIDTSKSVCTGSMLRAELYCSAICGGASPLVFFERLPRNLGGGGEKRAFVARGTLFPHPAFI